MKAITCIIAIALLAACNSSGTNNTTVNDTIPPDTSTANSITMPGKLCFQNITQRDTISIELFIKDTAAYGNLVYNMYEKDDNKGTFKGTMNGEIIKADYTFMSEGTNSVREVIFRLKDNTLTEGFGDMEEKNGKFMFKDTSKVNFSQAFTTVPCNE